MNAQVNNPKIATNKTTSSLRKWLKRSLILLLVITVISVLWVEYQMRLFRGEYSAVIETTDIQFLSSEYIIKDVSVLNPEGTDMLAGQDVIISKGKIKQLNRIRITHRLVRA